MAIHLTCLPGDLAVQAQAYTRCGRRSWHNNQTKQQQAAPAAGAVVSPEPKGASQAVSPTGQEQVQVQVQAATKQLQTRVVEAEKQVAQLDNQLVGEAAVREALTKSLKSLQAAQEESRKAHAPSDQALSDVIAKRLSRP